MRLYKNIEISIRYISAASRQGGTPPLHPPVKGYKEPKRLSIYFPARTGHT